MQAKLYLKQLLFFQPLLLQIVVFFFHLFEVSQIKNWNDCYFNKDEFLILHINA